METCEVIKSHLNELIPDVFFLYEKKVDSLEEEGRFNFKDYGIVFINKLLSLNKFEKDPALFQYKNTEEERINKHYGMRVVKAIIHETFCNNKLNLEYDCESPINFYNAEMKLIKIVPIKSQNYNDNYSKTTKKENKVESSKFFEYFFGLYYGRLVIDLIYEVNYIGKLINNVQYFVGKELNIIKKYITFKHLIAQNKIEYNEWNNNESLEDEIITIEKLIKDNQLKTLNEGKKEEDIKQDILLNSEFIEEEDKSEEYKGYNYYKKKVSEAKNVDEYFKYSAELYKHLKVV